MPTAMPVMRSTRSSCDPELVVIDDVGESGNAALQRVLAVLVIEELGVGQPRAHDAGIAGDDGMPPSVRFEVRHEQEAVQQAAACSRSAKYFWFCCIVRIRHSGGTSRNSFSKPDS